MLIDSAAPAYQLSDLKPADRLAVLRLLDLEVRGACFSPFELIGPTRTPVRTKYLALLNNAALLTQAVLGISTIVRRDIEGQSCRNSDASVVQIEIEKHLTG